MVRVRSRQLQIWELLRGGPDLGRNLKFSLQIGHTIMQTIIQTHVLTCPDGPRNKFEVKIQIVKICLVGADIGPNFKRQISKGHSILFVIQSCHTCSDKLKMWLSINQSAEFSDRSIDFPCFQLRSKDGPHLWNSKIVNVLLLNKCTWHLQMMVYIPIIQLNDWIINQCVFSIWTQDGASPWTLVFKAIWQLFA